MYIYFSYCGNGGSVQSLIVTVIGLRTILCFSVINGESKLTMTSKTFKSPLHSFKVALAIWSLPKRSANLIEITTKPSLLMRSFSLLSSCSCFMCCFETPGMKKIHCH